MNESLFLRRSKLQKSRGVSNVIRYSDFPFFQRSGDREKLGKRKGDKRPVTIKKLIRNESSHGLTGDRDQRPSGLRRFSDETHPLRSWARLLPLTSLNVPRNAFSYHTGENQAARLFLFRSKNDRDAFARSARPSSRHTASRCPSSFSVFFFCLMLFKRETKRERERDFYGTKQIIRTLRVS